MNPIGLLQMLALIAVANGTPVLAKRLLGDFFAQPLDGGVRFFDGRPLLGRSKTVRGLVLALLVTSAWGPIIGVDPAIGALAGAAAMAGDLASSFIKRRLGLAPSSRATGLDQIPESLLPLLACRTALGLSSLDIAAGVALFLLGEVLLSRLLYQVHLRDKPY